MHSSSRSPFLFPHPEQLISPRSFPPLHKDEEQFSSPFHYHPLFSSLRALHLVRRREDKPRDHQPRGRGGGKGQRNKRGQKAGTTFSPQGEIARDQKVPACTVFPIGGGGVYRKTEALLINPWMHCKINALYN